MAITYVGGKTATVAAANATWSTILTDLTGGSGSAPIAGDLIVASYGHATGGDAVTGVTTTGYTKLADLYQNHISDTNASTSIKFMGATPDTSVTFTAPGNANTGKTATISVWRGVDPATPIDVTTTTAGGINTLLANPPAITPITTGSVIIVIGFGGAPAAAGAGTKVFTTTGLTDFRSIYGIPASTASGFTIGSGYLEWTSGPYDHATFGFTGDDSVNQTWAAVTMALRPAPTAGDLTPTDLATAAPTTGATSVAQSHSLTASSIAAAAPTIQAVTVGQIHSLTAQGIATAAPTIASASLAQSHALTATGIATGQPTISTVAISQLLELTASGIATGTSTIGAASLAQVHGLSAQGVATDRPYAGTGSISQTHMLGSQGVATSSPKVSSASAGQIQILAVTGVTAGTFSIGASVAKLIHAIVVGNLATAPATVSFAQLNQLHALSAVGQATGSPTLPDTWLVQLHALVSREIKTGSVRIGKPDTRLPSVRRIATEALSTNYATGVSGPNQITSSSGPNTLTEH